MIKKCGIYKITSPSNKIYIGQSKDIERRFKGYQNTLIKKQIKLYNSFQKYEVKNHKFEIIEECEFEQLNIRERYWQDFYNCIENGLNCLYTETTIKKSYYGKDSFLRRSIAQKKVIKKYPVWNKSKINVYSDETLLKMSIIKKDKPSKIKGIKKPNKSGENHHYYNVKRPDISENQKGVKNPMYGKTAVNAKIVIDIITKQEFNSIKEAALFNKLNYSTLRQKINGSRQNNTNLIIKK